MKCMYCGCEDSKVIDSRSVDETNSIRRRRECLKCGRRFTTYEFIETTPILVVKRNGERQAFSLEKIRLSIMKACEKRPISSQQISIALSNIEKQIQNSMETEVQSSKIGEMVMAELKQMDEVAYVRFASVYKQFKDISTFYEFLSEFKDVINLNEKTTKKSKKKNTQN